MRKQPKLTASGLETRCGDRGPRREVEGHGREGAWIKRQYDQFPPRITSLLLITGALMNNEQRTHSRNPTHPGSPELL